MSATWAAPLTEHERAILARKLGRAGKSFWAGTLVPGKGRRSLSMLMLASAECGDLQRDVAEGAEVLAGAA
jgi:hypothetical protein